MNLTPNQLKDIIKEAIEPLVESQQPKLTITIGQAAELSGIGRDKLTELIFRGELPHFKVGVKTLINRDMFIEWVNEKSKNREDI